MSNRAVKVFTGNGTWTCPAGVTSLEVFGYGGGGAGGSGCESGSGKTHANGGGGGGGAQFGCTILTVTPGSVYTIGIGAGGLGEPYSASTGQPGGDSTIVVGGVTILRFLGAGPGEGGGAGNGVVVNNAGRGGTPVRSTSSLGYYQWLTLNGVAQIAVPGAGGRGYNYDQGYYTDHDGVGSPQGHVGGVGNGGTAGCADSCGGGGGGGGSPEGNVVGAYGGATVGAGLVGNNGLNGLWGGGGGGGSGGGYSASTFIAQGNGGNGGQGKLTLAWFE